MRTRTSDYELLTRAERAEYAIARIRRAMRKDISDSGVVTIIEGILDEYVVDAGLHIMQPKGD